jgi:hypothetical protein
MPRNPYQSFNTPFQSGCSLCKVSTDYQKYWQGGSRNNLVSTNASSPFDLKRNGYDAMKYAKELTGEGVALAKKNYGVSYQTTGGRKKGKTLKKKSNIKKKKKRSVIRKLSKPVMNKMKNLGKLVGAVGTMGKKTVNKVRKTSKKVMKKGCNTVKGTVNLTQKAIEDIFKMGTTGIKKTGNIGKRSVKIMKRSLKSKPKRKVTKRKVKKPVRKQRGGDTNWGATGLPMQFYDPKYQPKEVVSGVYDQDTPYGKYQPRGCPGATCNLMPFNPYQNPPSSVFKTGGAKKKKISRRKQSKKSKQSKRAQRGGLCLQQGNNLLSSAEGYPYSPRWGKEYCAKGGAKKRSPKKKRSLKW